MTADDRSPFPWIADEIWRRTRDIRADADLEGRWGATEELLVVAVTNEDRRRAPTIAISEGVPVPESIANLEAARELLQSRGGTGYTFPEGVAWLVCCDRLTTLIAEPAPETLPSLPHWTEAEATSDWGSPSSDFTCMDAPPKEPRSWWRNLIAGRDPVAEYQAEQRRAMEGIDGTHLLCCRHCGRLYFACHHP